jgi:predicted  nucleic acid-binding Zn-ribbon protein
VSTPTNDDAYEWVLDKQIRFAEDDFAKVQAERDTLKAKALELQTELDRLEKGIRPWPLTLTITNQ